MSEESLSKHSTIFLFSHVLKDLINNVPKDRLKKQKLMCVNDLVHSDLFRIPGMILSFFNPLCN